MFCHSSAQEPSVASLFQIKPKLLGPPASKLLIPAPHLRLGLFLQPAPLPPSSEHPAFSLGPQTVYTHACCSPPLLPLCLQRCPPFKALLHFCRLDHGALPTLPARAQPEASSSSETLERLRRQLTEPLGVTTWASRGMSRCGHVRNPPRG